MRFQDTFDAHLLKLTLSLVVAPPGGATPRRHDLRLDVSPDAHVSHLVDALTAHLRLTGTTHYGLLRRLISHPPPSPPGTEGYLPAELPIADCGLFDGVELFLLDRSQHRAPDLIID